MGNLQIVKYECDCRLAEIGQERSKRGSNVQLVFQEQESPYFHSKAKTWMGHSLFS